VLILIADDHEVIRRGIVKILQSRAGIECAEVGNGKEAVGKAVELNPDLILLDLSMPVLDGFSAAREIRQRLPDLPILFFSIYDTKEILNKARSMGEGMVLKDQAGTTLLEAVDALLRRETFFPS
jgi:DNA-binding NarL/FixJ family response regulator